MEDRTPEALASDQKWNEATDSLFDLSDEYARAAMEVLTSDEVLSHIPVIKTATAMLKVVSSVKDQILLRKLLDFLRVLASISAADRRAMVTRLREDPTYGNRIGEHIIELLDRIEGNRKPLMIAAAFAAYTNHEIDLKALHRLNGAIERLPAIEIPVVRRLGASYFLNMTGGKKPQDPIESESLVALANAGLVIAVPGFDGIRFDINEVGKAFLMLNLDLCTSN